MYLVINTAAILFYNVFTFYTLNVEYFVKRDALIYNISTLQLFRNMDLRNFDLLFFLSVKICAIFRYIQHFRLCT